MRRLLFMLAALCVAASPSFAQNPDAEGSKDHPAIPRLPNYYIGNFENPEFAAYDFILGEDKMKNVEGRHWRIDYWIKDGSKAMSALEIRRQYKNAGAKIGAKVIFEEGDNYGGRLTMQVPQKNLWFQIDISNGGEAYTLYVIEEKAMTQQVEFDASALAAELNAKGSVALHNILFDTGKSTLKPESTAALAPVGELLKNDAALRLEIQGHTDNVGAKDANLKLSRDRADAVKAHLVATFGVEAARLTTAGLGDTQPVAPNTTEEGRAQNRRVVLVKK